MDIYETVKTLNGNQVRRIQSSIFYWSSIFSLILGGYLALKGIAIAGFLLLTAFPFLMLYPAIRFLFGGKDSVVAVVATAVVEEVVKHKIIKSIEKKK